jgi:hypothetical protein
MRQTLIVLLVLGLLALGTAAFAQHGYGEQYAQKAYQGPRVQVGWAAPGDVDNSFIWGGSYIWKNALLSANYLTGDVKLAAVPGGSTKVISLEASYIWRAKTDPGLYFGAGYGMAWADTSDTPGGENDSHGLWNVVVGKDFNSRKEFGKPGLFAEARWNFGSSVDFTKAVSGDLNGVRVQVGWKF